MNQPATTIIAPPQEGESEPKPAEVVKLELVVRESGVAIETAQGLISAFGPIFANVHKLLEKAKAAPTVTDATQLAEMEYDHRLRLDLVRERKSGERLKDALKKDSLLRGNAVQGVFNLLKFMVMPIEDHLEEQEKFAERAEAKRIEEKRVARIAEITPFLSAPLAMELGTMPDSDYAVILDDVKAVHAARLAREQKEREDATAKAKSEKLRADRALILAPLRQFIDEIPADLGTLGDLAFAALIAEGEEARQIAKLRADRELALAPRRPFIKGAVPVHLGIIDDLHFASLMEDGAEGKRRDDAAREQQRLENERLQLRLDRERKVSVFTLAASVKRPADLSALATAEFIALVGKLSASHNAEKKRLADIEGAKEKELEDAKALRDAATAKEADRAKAEKEAAEAPLKVKLTTYAKAITAVPLGAIPGDTAVEVLVERDHFVTFILQLAKSL